MANPDIDSSHPPCNEWTQTSNPATNSTITGFRAISLDFSYNGRGEDFGGLGLCKAPSTLICDTPGDGSYGYSAIGALAFDGVETIPGPRWTPVSSVELHARRPAGCSAFMWDRGSGACHLGRGVRPTGGELTEYVLLQAGELEIGLV